MLIDTHAHLNELEYTSDLEEVIARATDAGVQRILSIGTGLQSSLRAVSLAERFPSLYAVVGIHPTSVEEEEQDFLKPLQEIASHPKVVAIGETGLDFHCLPSKTTTPCRGQSSKEVDGTAADEAYKSLQAKVFLQHLDLATQLGLNVVIHQRDAWEDTWRLLTPYSGRLRGVFHCFGGTIEQASEIIAGGHLISFTGIVTFNNAETVRNTVAQVPHNAYMVETDCPFLAPVPFRGKRCEPAHVRTVAEAISRVRGESLSTIAQQTTATARTFFQLK
ncbi:TatD family hydrolase [Candidatus Xiphinematobacter sp. Idaho Grape]|uniref:TatD family hydrolase n=1 Tax=Candidatus Xiphinematobacter sp. Idaho Grape TaxID=1704307 RepID=UPI0007835E9C|nr:TatD family hydrolase [Candidatus Xiphinematobacter sp. Idaho Grape]